MGGAVKTSILNVLFSVYMPSIIIIREPSNMKNFYFPFEQHLTCTKIGDLILWSSDTSCALINKLPGGNCRFWLILKNRFRTDNWLFKASIDTASLQLGFYCYFTSKWNSVSYCASTPILINVHTGITLKSVKSWRICVIRCLRLKDKKYLLVIN